MTLLSVLSLSGQKIALTACTKIRELKDTIQEKKPDMICITETKLTKESSIEALGLDTRNYNVWRKERTCKEGGGIMIMTKKELTALEIEQMPAHTIQDQ